MHPGQLMRIELSHELVHSEKSLISKQVENGVYVRQKIMEKLLNENRLLLRDFRLFDPSEKLDKISDI